MKSVIRFGTNSDKSRETPGFSVQVLENPAKTTPAKTKVKYSIKFTFPFSNYL